MRLTVRKLKGLGAITVHKLKKKKRMMKRITLTCPSMKTSSSISNEKILN
jgi:Ser-tRNA(Ala) deacylase AlaX